MKYLALCLLPLLLLFAGCASNPFKLEMVNAPYTDTAALKEGQIVHLPTGRLLSESELADFLARQRVVYVGESHDNVEDHEVQLKILKSLYAKNPGKVALGLEMLRTDSQEGADGWASGAMDEKEFVKLWIKNWGASYPYYSEIMAFVKEKRIPLIALNRPRPAMGAHKPVKQEGSEPPPKKLELPPEPEIDSADPYYEAFIGAFMAGHDSGGADIKKMFMKGQLLWDETMAQTGADYLKKPENADKQLVVFAGGNHVRYGIGIPRRLHRRLPDAYAIVSPTVLNFPKEKEEKLMDVDVPLLPLREADILWAVGYTDLEGEIIRMGVGIMDSEKGGVAVTEVFPGSVAQKAGVLAGDVLTELDGVAIKETFDLTFELMKKKKGAPGKLRLKRGEEEKELLFSYDVLKHES